MPEIQLVVIYLFRAKFIEFTVSKPFGDEAEPCGSRMQNMLVRSQAPSLGVFLRLFPEPNTSMMQ